MPEALTRSQPDLTGLIDDALPSLVGLRRELHAHPQLGFEETFAAAVICRELAAEGVSFEGGIAGTGVVGWIEPAHESIGSEPIALRADMDALPITEQTGLPYASRQAGLMHACGHDGHMAILLGTARVLARLRPLLPRGVKLLFQPAEEEGGGAARMIEAGALDACVGRMKARRVFGLHAWPSLPLGTIGTRVGTLMAARDHLRITLEGRGGHAAMPHMAADPIVAAAHVVVALQSIVSRNLDPTVPGVISVGSIHAGHASNVTPDRAELTGTIRVLDDETRQLLHGRIRDVVNGVARALGCQAEVLIERSYPATANDVDSVRHIRDAGAGAVAPGCVIELDRPSMAAEDFAFYGQRLPSGFFFLGTRPADAPAAPDLHTSHFDFNDDAIRIGVDVMCRLALNPAP